MKPFQDARFAAALARAKSELRRDQAEGLDRRVDQLLTYVAGLAKGGDASPKEPQSPPEPAEHFVVKAGSDHHFIKKRDIIWIEAEGDFVKVQTIGPSRLMRATLQEVQQQLDPAKFLRVHRSFLVNISHVRQITPALYGDYAILMSDGSKLRLSRTYRGKLKAILARRSAT